MHCLNAWHFVNIINCHLFAVHALYYTAAINHTDFAERGLALPQFYFISFYSFLAINMQKQ